MATLTVTDEMMAELLAGQPIEAVAGASMFGRQAGVAPSLREAGFMTDDILHVNTIDIQLDKACALVETCRTRARIAAVREYDDRIKLTLVNWL